MYMYTSFIAMLCRALPLARRDNQSTSMSEGRRWMALSHGWMDVCTGVGRGGGVRYGWRETHGGRRVGGGLTDGGRREGDGWMVWTDGMIAQA